jgi:hypothetical protein
MRMDATCSSRSDGSLALLTRSDASGVGSAPSIVAPTWPPAALTGLRSGSPCLRAQPCYGPRLLCLRAGNVERSSRSPPGHVQVACRTPRDPPTLALTCMSGAAGDACTYTRVDLQARGAGLEPACVPLPRVGARRPWSLAHCAPGCWRPRGPHRRHAPGRRPCGRPGSPCCARRP